MLLGWIWESATPLFMGYISNVKFLIANNISVILEIKNDRCKIVKILIFCSLSREHFQIDKHGSLKSGSHGDYKNNG